MQKNPARDDLKFVLFNADKQVWDGMKRAAKTDDIPLASLARRFLKEGLERHIAQMGGREQAA